MSVQQVRMKDWKAVCPKCQHIQYSEKDKNAFCGNCDAPAMMTYGQSSNGWQSAEARQSWRQLQCSKGCGWTCNNVKCSGCGATIRGDYFIGSTKWCFVATACFDDEDHPTVEALRKFRDGRLLNSKLGERFVAFYYVHGKSAAKIFEYAPLLKHVMRPLLTMVAKMLGNKG